LTPTWVPRSFLHPGRRIKLHPSDYYRFGADRGGIDERWFGSTTEAANEGRVWHEGQSFVVHNGRQFLLKDAVAEAGRVAGVERRARLAREHRRDRERRGRDAEERDREPVAAGRLVVEKGDAAAAAEEAGADVVGQDDLAKRIKDGWLEFDACIAAPDMMGVVGPLGRVLGPRGLMPSPRAGTVTPDVARVVKEYKAGKVEFRNDNGGIVHAVVGRLSFDPDKLAENIQAFIDHINGMKPQAVKGTYVRGIAISATMSPSVRVAA